MRSGLGLARTTRGDVHGLPAEPRSGSWREVGLDLQRHDLDAVDPLLAGTSEKPSHGRPAVAEVLTTSTCEVACRVRVRTTVVG